MFVATASSLARPRRKELVVHHQLLSRRLRFPRNFTGGQGLMLGVTVKCFNHFVQGGPRFIRPSPSLPCPLRVCVLLPGRIGTASGITARGHKRRAGIPARRMRAVSRWWRASRRWSISGASTTTSFGQTRWFLFCVGVGVARFVSC